MIAYAEYRAFRSKLEAETVQSDVWHEVVSEFLYAEGPYGYRERNTLMRFALSSLGVKADPETARSLLERFGEKIAGALGAPDERDVHIAAYTGRCMFEYLEQSEAGKRD